MLKMATCVAGAYQFLLYNKITFIHSSASVGLKKYTTAALLFCYALFTDIFFLNATGINKTRIPLCSENIDGVQFCNFVIELFVLLA